MTKNCMYSMPSSCGKVYKDETCHPLKLGLEEHRKAVCWREVEKLAKTDHEWKEKGNILSLWDEVKIIDMEEHWKIRHLKEAVQMLGYSDLFSKPSMEMNMIWQPLIKKAQ